MTETPGNDGNNGDDNTDKVGDAEANAAEQPQSSEGFGTWQAPNASARQTGEQPTVGQPENGEGDADRAADAQPTEEYPAAQPTAAYPTEEYPAAQPEGTQPTAASPTEEYPAGPVGAPPLPGETPVPLAETAAASTASAEPADGVHRAPASLDHAAYAGSNSAAYGSLSQPGTDGQPAPASGAPAEGAPSATDSASPYGVPAYGAPVAAARPRKRGLGALVAVAVVAAVIGALVATGGYALFSRSSTADGGTPSNLTIGHYKDATVITAVAAKATPSVVTINVSSGTSAGTGSGVVLTSDGYIVTNTHVVTLDGASATGSVTVTTATGRIYAGKIIGTDPLVDLAVIKINASGMKPIQFANSSKLNVGDTAVAIGAPLGLSNTVTDGIVSTLNRSISVASSAAPSTGGDSSQGDSNNGQGPFSFDNGSGTNSSGSLISLPVIQTDASINPGNSGGALLDSKGKLIGINVAIASAGSTSDSGSQSGSIGVGFSIPANLVKRVANDIKSTGSATHGLLGASVADATSDTTATHTGALIKSLASGGAAEKAGLRAGDVVTQFDGNPVTGATDLTAQVRTLAGGATGSLTYIRDGSTKTTTVSLGTLKG